MRARNRVEIGFCTDAPGYVGWRNRFFGFWAPWKFKNTVSAASATRRDGIGMTRVPAWLGICDLSVKCWRMVACISFIPGHHDLIQPSPSGRPLSFSLSLFSGTTGGIYPHYIYGKDKAQLPFSSLVFYSLCFQVPVGAGGGLGRNYSYKRCLGGFNKNGYNRFRSRPLQYTVYEYKYLKVLHQTIYEKHLSLNCLADHLEKDFILSKQLVTVGLLVPAQYQLSNTCICNRCALHLNSHDYIIQYIVLYSTYMGAYF